MTYWVEQQPDWEQQLKYYGGIPRLAEVEELGGAYVYLLSDAASYTTSIDIPVNGVIGSKSEQSNPEEVKLTTGSLLVVQASNSSRLLLRPMLPQFICKIGVHRPSGMSLMILNEIGNAAPLCVVVAVQACCEKTLSGHQARGIVAQLEGDAANCVDAILHQISIENIPWH